MTQAERDRLVALKKANMKLHLAIGILSFVTLLAGVASGDDGKVPPLPHNTTAAYAHLGRSNPGCGTRAPGHAVYRLQGQRR